MMMSDDQAILSNILIIIIMIDLHNDDRQNLRHWPVGQERGPCHVGAHCAWIYLIIIMNNSIDYFDEITITIIIIVLYVGVQLARDLSVAGGVV